jgi:hypothetical protein
MLIHAGITLKDVAIKIWSKKIGIWILPIFNLFSCILMQVLFWTNFQKGSLRYEFKQAPLSLESYLGRQISNMHRAKDFSCMPSPSEHLEVDLTYCAVNTYVPKLSLLSNGPTSSLIDLLLVQKLHKLQKRKAKTLKHYHDASFHP